MLNEVYSLQYEFVRLNPRGMQVIKFNHPVGICIQKFKIYGITNMATISFQKNYRKNSLYTSMDNKLNIINGKIIQQYLINRNMSETEFDEFITGDGFLKALVT